jgi:transcription termination/antitermination protein NusG
MAKQTQNLGRRWYVIHVYTGYEDSVAKNIRHRAEAMDMKDKIFNVLVPKERKIKVKGGKRITIDERIFPGYVLIEMTVDDNSWYLVRNTPNVTGFVGSGVVPTPISDEEVAALKKRMGVKEPKYKIDFSNGSLVKITDGAFKAQEGKVNKIDEERGKVTVLVNMFGRETPVTLDFLQVKKM